MKLLSIIVTGYIIAEIMIQSFLLGAYTERRKHEPISITFEDFGANGHDSLSDYKAFYYAVKFGAKYRIVKTITGEPNSNYILKKEDTIKLTGGRWGTLKHAKP